MILTNSEIIKKYRVGAQGGIRKSNANKCSVLIINDKVKKYRDSFTEYQGEYRKGHKDQILKYGNKHLSECGVNWPLYIFTKTPNGEGYEYVGEYFRNGASEYRRVGDKWAYFFPIRPAYPFDSFEY